MWNYTMPGVFSLSVDDKERIGLDIKKPQLAPYEAFQLADALTQAGHAVAYHKTFGIHQDSRVLTSKP